LALEVGLASMSPSSFPSQSSLVEVVLPAMVKRTLDQHVLPNLKIATIVSVSFNLWMSHNGVDTFALVINFLNEAWASMHVIVGLFEVHETFKQSMAIKLYTLLKKYGLLHRIIAFVKDEGNNLTPMVVTL
jgi:hypothetical protein